MSNSSRGTRPQADVLVCGDGSLYVFQILSEPARTWVQENVSQEGFQPNFPHSLYVEHRYAAAVKGAEMMRPITIDLREGTLVIRTPRNKIIIQVGKKTWIEVRKTSENACATESKSPSS